MDIVNHQEKKDSIKIFLRKLRNIIANGTDTISIEERNKNNIFRIEEGFEEDNYICELNSLRLCDYYESGDDHKIKGRIWHIFMKKYVNADNDTIWLYIKIRVIEEPIKTVCLSFHEAANSPEHIFPFEIT